MNKKIMVLLTAILVVSVVFLSGCTEQNNDSNDEEDKSWVVAEVSGTADSVDIHYSIRRNPQSCYTRNVSETASNFSLATDLWDWHAFGCKGDFFSLTVQNITNGWADAHIMVDDVVQEESGLTWDDEGAINLSVRLS